MGDSVLREPHRGHRFIMNVEWVMKISKLCNLRCTYCYEFPFLAEKDRMSLVDLKRMFGHIADFYAPAPKRMDFVWHGGEPLLIEPDYYKRILELQHETFDPVNVPFTNSIQTNLTILNDEILKLFKSLFRNIGVSLDLFGDQRVTIAGRPSQKVVLKNIQRLIDEQIPFGCITVLSRATAPYVEEIYHFFENIQKSFRLLPIYRTGYKGQQDTLALTDAEIVTAFKQAVDLWLMSDSNIKVQPIEDYIKNVVWYLHGAERRNYYGKEEVVYIVNTDGSLFSDTDTPYPEFCHGNIFRDTLASLKRSAGYLNAVNTASQRMKDVCSQCQYYGICSGYDMVDATREERYRGLDGRLKCGVAKPVQEYIESVLIDSRAFDPKRRRSSFKQIRAKALNHDASESARSRSVATARG